ncbi:putative baseplate assembly protein, partial [Myxococcota bacterium]|nr:putative baseplate assembly protein [Myxococcota bacterium]
DGSTANANPARRHAVRLCAEPQLTTDALGGRFKPEPDDSAVPVTEIEWHPRDALPFALTLSSRRGTAYFDELSLAHGNIVLADHGLSTTCALPQVPAANPVLKPVPATCRPPCGEASPAEPRPQHARFRPRLPTTGQPITQASPLPGGQLPDAARDALDQDIRQAIAQIVLDADGSTWQARRDLLASSPQDTAFVVEIEADGSAWLRFGDGEFGRHPAAGTLLEATLRLGNGSAGNLGAGIRPAESPLFHLASVEAPPVEAVWNPLPARGGVEPESIESVRQRAPSAIAGDIQRAVT